MKSMVNSRSPSRSLANRVRIVLMGAKGLPNREIAHQVNLSRQMLCKWRQRHLQQGLSDLHDELRPRQIRSISDEEVALRIRIRKTLQTKPKDGTH